jgi:SHS2 domain-containing protein
MGYEILPHTADLRIRVRGQTLEEVFRSALGGISEVMQPRAARRSLDRERPVLVTAPDIAMLLVDCLSEALTLAHIHRELYPDAWIEELVSTTIRATLRGTQVPGFARDIKAVTYHAVEVTPSDGGGHEATVVFDV